MASGSAALLKATMLLDVVLPSSARCQSSRSAPAPAPAPPPPAPAPAPGPPAAVRCSDCPAYCAAAVAMAGVCGKYCNPPPICDGCKSRALQECTACCGTGGGCSTGSGGGHCGACDYCGGGGCDGHVESRCRQGACYVNDGACKGCRDMEEQHCIDYYCNSNCVQ